MEKIEAKKELIKAKVGEKVAKKKEAAIPEESKNEKSEVVEESKDE